MTPTTALIEAATLTEEERIPLLLERDIATAARDKALWAVSGLVPEDLWHSIAQAHFVDIAVRVNGQTIMFQGDWLKELMPERLESAGIEKPKGDSGEP